MRKKILISNVSDSNLLNGEINNTSVNINNEIKSIKTSESQNILYDRIIGVLEVNENNEAVEYENNHFNFKVFIRKNDKTVLSKRLNTLSYSDMDDETRLIDTIEPFSEIKRVFLNEVGEQSDYSLSTMREKYNHISDNVYTDYELDKIYDLNKNVKTPVRMFTEIPKFYYRTYFLEKDGNYFRNYEIITVDTYKSLPNELRTGFSVPFAFYTWEKIETDKEVLIEGFKNAGLVPYNDSRVLYFDLTGMKYSDFDVFDLEIISEDGSTIPKLGFGTGSIIYNSLSDEFEIDEDITSDPQSELNNFGIIGNILYLVFNDDVQDENLALKVNIINNDSVHRICLERNKLRISSSPVTQNWGGLLSGNKLNILEFAESTIESKGYVIERDFMDLETYYGVICYLLRLYTGVFDIYELFHQDSNTCYIGTIGSLNTTDSYLSSEAVFGTAYERVINRTNLNAYKLLGNSGIISIRRDWLEIFNYCYLLSSSDISSIDRTGEFDRKVINCTTTYIPSSGYITTIDISDIPDGEYFVTNVFIMPELGQYSSYGNQNVTKSYDDCFKLIKSNGVLSINNEFLTNFYIENNVLKFKQNDLPIGEDYYLCFFLYRCQTSSTNKGRRSLFLRNKTISFSIKRFNSLGVKTKECVLDCFITRSSLSEMQSSIKDCILYPRDGNYWTDNNKPLQGACLSESFIKEYLNDMFSGYSTAALGDDKIVITFHNNYWNHINGFYEENDYYPLRIFDSKNKRIGNVLNILNLVGLFSAPRFDYYHNLDLSLNKKEGYVSRYKNSNDEVICNLDYYVESKFYHKGVIVYGMELDNTDLNVTLKDRKYQYYSYIDAITTFHNNANMSIAKFYCDDLSRCDNINGVYYYQSFYSYLEIPVNTSSNTTHTYFKTEDISFLNKRDGNISHEVNGSSDYYNIAIMSSLFNDYNIQNIETNNSSLYTIRPSLYSIVLCNNEYQKLDLTDDAQKTMLNFEYIDESTFSNNMSNDLTGFLNYKNNIFVVKTSI